ncbi:MAG: DUF1330 domain-containing protein [Henriciella sp.]|jgi:hypothetical protein
MFDTQTYLHPSRAAGAAFIMRGIAGEVTMLNLLRFRAEADYSSHPELAQTVPISGAAAYDKYIAHTLPFLHESGGDIVFLGKGGPFLTGPDHEYWDMVMLVRHRDTETFLTFADNKAYLAGTGHRTAALEDSRLLPLSDWG